MTTDLTDIECPSCGSALCSPGYCSLFYPRPRHLDLKPATTVDDPDWPGGRPVTAAMA